MAEGLLDRLLRPKIVFGALGVIVIIAALLLPDTGSDDARGTLSSTSYEPSGLRGWYEGSARLGWRVKRRMERFHGSLPDSAVYVVLDPDLEPTAGEVGVLLDAVRKGAGLIVSASHHSPLGDSLHLYTDNVQYGGYPVAGGSIPWPRIAATDSASVATALAGSADEDDEDESSDSTASDTTATAAVTVRDSAERLPRIPTELAAYSYHVRAALTATRPIPPDARPFLSVMAIATLVPVRKPAVLGVPLGSGRVVVLADPGIVRNGILDEEKLVVLPQRLLEWVAPSTRAPVIFDEYHHGLGRHGSMMAAIQRALTDTIAGRAGLQVMLAGLVLLLALAARPIAPQPRMRLERRSPLEHVGALSRAYLQKGATRLAARRLVHGIRRRHGAAARSGDDKAWLRRVAERHPALKPNVDRLVAATQHAVSPRDFTLLADDIDTIERTLRT